MGTLFLKNVKNLADENKNGQNKTNLENKKQIEQGKISNKQNL